ncbi:MAG: hypothetical protein K0R29_2147 [Pseudobdellovibrio sp.]|jgi:hypothetical protein|nr:hypothetical protein [Pseudobdellovibrio sp.]
MTDDGQGEKLLNEAYDGLENQTPDRVARIIRWLRNPKAKWVRLPLGILLIIGGFFGFLPILGIEMIPIGLLLVAQDIPFLQKPVGKAVIWLEVKWVHLRKWWQLHKRRQKHAN